MSDIAGALLRKSRTPEGKKMFRYIVVSGFTTLLGFVLLGLVFGVLHLWSETPSAIVTSVVATVPAYYMNRSFVWRKSGRSHWRREVLPFWAVSVAGILVTVAAAAESHRISTTHHFSHSQATILLLAITLTAAGVLWAIKFLIFNRLFVMNPEREMSDQSHPGVNEDAGVATSGSPMRWAKALMPIRPARSSSLPISLEDESTAVVALFPRVAAAAVLLLAVIITIRGAGGTKSWDKAAFALSVVVAALFATSYLRRSTTIRPSRLALVVCVGGFLWGIAVVERPYLSHLFWEGFGKSVALVSIAVAILVIPLSAWIRGSRARAITFGVLVTPVAVFDLLSLIRDTYDFAYTSNNVFVLNEVLAPAAGRVPGANFVPQYTLLFGWLLVPFRHLLSAGAMVNLASMLLSGLGVIAVVVTVVLARRCLPSRSLWLAVIVTVPLVSVTVLHDPTASSIGSYFQELPIRMFPAILCTVIAVRALDGLLVGVLRTWTLVALGALAGLMAWNSQDIGVVVAIASGIVLQLAARGSLRKRATALWLAGLLPGLAVYPLWALAAGHALNVNYFALTVRSFGGGFGSAPIQVPGPVLLVLPVLLGSAVVGTCLLWRSAGKASKLPDHTRLAIVTLAFVGLWSVGFLPYYVNRSYASGQLQVFLLPFALCSSALLSLCLDLLPVGARDRTRSKSSLRNPAVWLLPVTLPVAVGVGALLQTPDPSTTLSSLFHAPAPNDFASTLDETETQTPGSGWPGPPGSTLSALVTKQISIARSYARNHGGGSVGYFGLDANYLTLSTGVQSRLLYDDPVDFSIGRSAHQLGCAFLLHDPTTWLVTTPGATAIAGATMCGAYESLSVPKELPGTLFKLRHAH